MYESPSNGERITEQGEKLIVETEGRFSAVNVIERAKSKGWSSVTITEGSPELKRSIWLEGTMNNLSVAGYNPTFADRTLLEQLKKQRRSRPGEYLVRTGEQIAADYARRVIPVLKRSYETFDTQKRKQRTRLDEMGEQGGLYRPGSVASRELDNRLYYSRQALNKAVEAYAYFSGLGRREVKVKENFEDGVLRYVTEDLNQRRILEHNLRHSAGRSR